VKRICLRSKYGWCRQFRSEAGWVSVPRRTFVMFSWEASAVPPRKAFKSRRSLRKQRVDRLANKAFRGLVWLVVGIVAFVAIVALLDWYFYHRVGRPFRLR
jgi:hypothetical protein